MDKKAIQNERMKGYFIEAAKKIIKEEGVDKLTVKKVADAAGYAQGTLYNYFENLDRLLFHCIKDYFVECEDSVINKIDNYTTVTEKLINSATAYSRYFIEHPNVYQLIFMENLSYPPEEKIGEQGYIPKIIKILRGILEECAQEGIIKEEEVTIIRNLIGNSIHGNLLFFINDVKKVRTKQEVLKKIETEVEYLLKK